MYVYEMLQFYRFDFLYKLFKRIETLIERKKLLKIQHFFFFFCYNRHNIVFISLIATEKKYFEPHRHKLNDI